VSLTQARLKELLSYDRGTGVFVWLRPPLRLSKLIGQVAGCNRGDGYIRIVIGGYSYAAHRLAWLYVHGVWPAGRLDHRDTNKSNNQVANLRLVDASRNAANAHPPKNNTSGIKGVSWVKSRSRWQAQITFQNKHINLGHFDRIEDAAAAYAKAANDHFGEFARCA
jgi:hypothetical protein